MEILEVINFEPIEAMLDEVLAAIPCVGPPPITRQKAHLGAA